MNKTDIVEMKQELFPRYQGTTLYNDTFKICQTQPKVDLNIFLEISKNLSKSVNYSG